MKFAFGSWAFSFGPYARQPLPFNEVARIVSAAGYQGIEASGFPPHVTLDAYPSGPARRELAAMLNGLGLQLSGYSADFTCVNPLTPGNKQRYLEVFRRNLELCVDLKSPMMRVDTVGAPGSFEDYAGAIKQLAEVWNVAAEIAGLTGVRVLWEFEPGFAINKISEVQALVRQITNPAFGLIFDTCHAYMCSVVGARQQGTPETVHGGVSECLKRLGDRIGHLHLIDSDGSLYGEETSTHRFFGQGLIDFPQIAPQLRALPIEWWTVDLCFMPDAAKWVVPSLDYVKRLAQV